nr:NUDIX domain-containing protein [Micromonospora sp. HNM0581]
MFVGARAVVRDNSARILLIRRSDNGQWALPAGAMELGESIADCAVREVREETGLRALRVNAFALYTGPDRTHTNMYGHTYQIFTAAFRVEEWDGRLTRVTDETIDAGFFHHHAMPQPLSGSVVETLADLDVFEQTNRLILK